MARMFLCLGVLLLTTVLAAALSGFVSDDSPAARVGVYLFLGLSVLSLVASLLLGRWERSGRDQSRRDSDARHAPRKAAQPDAGRSPHTEGKASPCEVCRLCY